MPVPIRKEEGFIERFSLFRKKDMFYSVVNKILFPTPFVNRSALRFICGIFVFAVTWILLGRSSEANISSTMWKQFMVSCFHDVTLSCGNICLSSLLAARDVSPARSAEKRLFSQAVVILKPQVASSVQPDLSPPNQERRG